MIYGYTRVSTEEQKTEPQLLELVNAGVPSNNVYSEHISGSIVAHSRPVLAELLQKLKEGDTLTVLKLNRLGRDAIDVLSLIKEKGIGVRILQLGADTSGSAGSLIIGILATVAS
ncbi:DNA recombinase/resolvase [Acetobacter malorum]|uniref:DNA recombinase/resolvase n=1 Tax=Acetobacter malorum TaxID=178901 RepID=A0A177G5L2_9PROT|nr:recombinase family protein [Acetobacter malorum]OAG75116.1 DNA recombinase/resolvase [Acetobacter malorum]